MSSAAAFGEIERRVNLVGAVDRDVERADLIGADHPESERGGQLMGLHRSGGADDVERPFTEFDDGPVHGGSGAETNLHAIGDIAGGVAASFFLGPVTGSCIAHGESLALPPASSRMTAALGRGFRSLSMNPVGADSPH